MLREIINAHRVANPKRIPSTKFKTVLRELADALEHAESARPIAAKKKVYRVYVYMDPLRPTPCTFVLPSGKRLTLPAVPFYIGYGVEGRPSAHVREARKYIDSGKKGKLYNPHKTRTIVRMLEAGKQPLIMEAGDYTAYYAKACEVDLIAGIGRRDLKTGTLTNLTNGGEGLVGYVPTVETRALQSAAKKGIAPSEKARLANIKAIKGTKQTPEHVAKRTSQRIGIYVPPEVGRRISEAKKGKAISTSVAVRVDGVRYASYALAAEALGLAYHSVKQRTKSKSFPNYRLA